LQAAEALLTTDNPNFDDFQKITDAIEAIQATLSVDDANYDTLQKIVDKLKIAETKLATIETDADVNVQSDWNETNNTSDAFIANKPTLGTASSKDVGTATGNIQENGAILGNLQTVETDATGKFITVGKNTAYNANFGTGNTDVARGDASYLKADTYTQTEINNALATNSTNDRARANHTGEQAISTVTGLQTALDAKEATANKGVANGYASLDGNTQVPLSQIPANAKSSKVVADIATRDVIANADRFEGLRVHVLNATADTTVTSGSAGYILKSGLANTDWEKTYESESLDIDLTDYFNKTTDTTDNITEGTAKFTTQANIDKLAGIEPNATADQTAAEIKTAYESNVNTNAFTDAEQTKLVGIDSGATANSADAFLLARANHTGTQTLSTISDAGLLAAKDTIASTDVDNNAITTAKIQQFASKTVVGRTSPSTGDVEEIDIATTLKADLNLTSTDVGLGNVNNTSDADKPISTATQTALDAKLAKASNLTDVANRQTAANNLTDVNSGNNEYVYTKDTATGNALWKPAAGGGSGTNLSIGTITGTTLDINSDTGNDATIPAATLSNAGLLTSSDKAKLDSVEANATADQTAAEIKTAYESNGDTNAFTDAEQTKLAGIDSNLVGKLPTGAVVMSINSSLAGALKFDGVSSYSKSTYSALYSLISEEVGAAFDVDANNFYLPDPEGRALGVSGTPFSESVRSLFQQTGLQSFSMAPNQMPSHNHGEPEPGGGGFITHLDGPNSLNDGSIAATVNSNEPYKFGLYATTASAGSGSPINLEQPTLYVAKNLFIYY
jgi:microcystin-dependent protein